MVAITSCATVFLITAIHAIGIGITTPSQWDAVATLAVELVLFTAWLAFFLWRNKVWRHFRSESRDLVLSKLLLCLNQ